MICRNLTEYYNIFFNKLAFQYYQYDNFSLYINPQQPEEFIIHVHIADMYELLLVILLHPMILKYHLK